MKTFLAGLASGFLAGIVVWGLMVLLRPETEVERALVVLEIAFVAGAIVGGFWSWRRRRRERQIV